MFVLKTYFYFILIGDKMKNQDLNILVSNIEKVIHEPARLKILIYLNILKNADFVFLLAKTGLTKGNLSSHITKLENAGYVKVEKEFINKIPRTLISITKSGRESLTLYKKNILNLLNII
jgi:DNA-binding transcriptional ArsR family regulator